jgi:hypothetical protein
MRKGGSRASPEGIRPASMLALDGREVGTVIGVSHGPAIGAALRWLRAEVAINPELNTPAALTALLRFAAPCERGAPRRSTVADLERSPWKAGKRLAPPARSQASP